MAKNKKLRLKRYTIKLMIAIIAILLIIFLMKSIIIFNTGFIKYFMLLADMFLIIILDIFVFTAMMYLVFIIDSYKRN